VVGHGLGVVGLDGTATVGVLGREERGRHLLAQFHGVAAEHPGDPRFAEIIGDLTEHSEAFRAWWPKRRVEQALTTQIALRQPHVGVIALDVTELKVVAHPSLTLCVQVPHRPTDHERLRELLGPS
jgi:hypothetical protein